VGCAADAQYPHEFGVVTGPGISGADREPVLGRAGRRVLQADAQHAGVLVAVQPVAPGPVGEHGLPVEGSHGTGVSGGTDKSERVEHVDDDLAG
jgi:hypothetical protein